ncbi:MAG: hypothetical protein R3F14_27195 [Polyangiaceae bacterium]
MSPPVDLWDRAVQCPGPLGDVGRALGRRLAAHGQITGEETATRSALNAWIEAPEPRVALLHAAPGSGASTLLSRWLPQAEARGFSLLWVPLHGVLGLGTTRAFLAQLGATLLADEPRLTYARDPESRFRWCQKATGYNRDLDEGEPPRLIVLDGLHEPQGTLPESWLTSLRPGEHVKLLYTAHDSSASPGATLIPLPGETPPSMLRNLTALLDSPGSSAARRGLTTLAASPRPVPLRALRHMVGADTITALLASDVCVRVEGDCIRLSHGAYRSLLLRQFGPIAWAAVRAELGDACLGLRGGAADASVQALLAELVGEQWPSLPAAGRLLDPAWLRARTAGEGALPAFMMDSPAPTGGSPAARPSPGRPAAPHREDTAALEVLADLRAARTAAFASMRVVPSAGDRPSAGGPPSPIRPALGIIAECTVWEAVIASLCQGRVATPRKSLRLRSEPLARRLRDARAHFPSESLSPGRKASSRKPMRAERAGRAAPLPPLESLRRRWKGGVPERSLPLWIAALVTAGQTEEARRVLAEVPFSQAMLFLRAAAAYPDQSELATLARASIDRLDSGLHPSLVGVLPREAYAVLGFEKAMRMAARGPEYRRVEAWTALLPFLPTTEDKEVAALAAFAAFEHLPPGDDAEPMIFRALPWLPELEVVAVMDRLLASGMDFDVQTLFSPTAPCALPPHLPAFWRLAGTPGEASVWRAIARVASALEGD